MSRLSRLSYGTHGASRCHWIPTTKQSTGAYIRNRVQHTAAAPSKILRAIPNLTSPGIGVPIQAAFLLRGTRAIKQTGRLGNPPKLKQKIASNSPHLHSGSRSAWATPELQPFIRFFDIPYLHEVIKQPVQRASKKREDA